MYILTVNMRDVADVRIFKTVQAAERRAQKWGLKKFRIVKLGAVVKHGQLRLK